MSVRTVAHREPSSRPRARPERRVLVCGGRDFANAEFVAKVLGQYLASYPGLVIGCGYDPEDDRFQGADQLAYEWAGKHRVPRLCWPAKWRTYGRAAGPIRNGQQLAEFEPRDVIAFPGGRGTADMVRRARAAGHIVGFYGPADGALGRQDERSSNNGKNTNNNPSPQGMDGEK